MKDFLTFPFEMKSEVNEEGVFEGYGSTFDGKKDSPRPEWWGDIVEKGAFTNTIKKGGRNGTGILMLFNHDRDKEHGVWLDLHEDEKGLFMKGQFALDTQLGRERYSIFKMKKHGLFSIGFDTLKYRLDEKSYTRYLEEVELWEVSDVTFPRNRKAKTTSIKSIESAKNIRELEDALRDVGDLSLKEAQWIISLCKNSVRDVKNKVTSEEKYMTSILDNLRTINQTMEISKELSNCFGGGK